MRIFKYSVMAMISAMLAGAASAAVGVSIGANKFADDGFPMLAKDEQTKMFYCSGNGTGADALECAFKKCMTHFKAKNDNGKLKGQTTVYGGHCTKDGWSERKGYALGYVGPKGDNQFLMSKAIGDKTRADAEEYVKSNKFPIDKATKVFDF